MRARENKTKVLAWSKKFASFLLRWKRILLKTHLRDRSRARVVLPATAPRTPGMPWVYVISCAAVLVHKGWYFWIDHETTDDIRPTTSPMINEAHISIEPEDALTPDVQGMKTKRWFVFHLNVILKQLFHERTLYISDDKKPTRHVALSWITQAQVE